MFHTTIQVFPLRTRWPLYVNWPEPAGVVAIRPALVLTALHGPYGVAEYQAVTSSHHQPSHRFADSM
jgi:hypothetical protein